MKSRKITVFGIIKFLLIFAFLVGMVGIFLYPFDNRNLNIHFINSEEEYIISKTNDEISSATENLIFQFPEEVSEVDIERVLIYGQSSTMLLREVECRELFLSIMQLEGQQVTCTNNVINAVAENEVVLTLRGDFIELLQDCSASFIQERIIMVGFFFAFVAILFFVCNAFQERMQDNRVKNDGPLQEMKRFIADIKKYRQYISYSAKANLKAEVANSYLNRLWWLLEPFFNMLVYVIVFGNVMGNSIENYPVFVFSALLMWNFFSKTVNFSVKLVRNNRDIISKIYVPKFVLLLSNMSLNLYKLWFSWIVLVAMLLVFRVEIGINILWVIPAYCVMILLAFGVGMIFMHFGVYIDDLSYAVTILLNMLMFLSGVFYNMMTTLESPMNSILMTLNPVSVVIDTMRNALLYNRISNLPSLCMWFALSIVFCCIGVHIVYRNENSYVKIV